MRQYFSDLFSAVTSVLIGMKVTFSHLFTRSITLQYPREKAPMFDRSRNRLHVDIEDCIGCYQCDKACPVDCIHIDTIKARPGEDLGLTVKFEKKKTFVFPKFDIDASTLRSNVNGTQISHGDHTIHSSSIPPYQYRISEKQMSSFSQI